MSTAGELNFSKVSVYVKQLSVALPPRIEGVQFGFGQVCGAERIGLLTICDGTLNCPFFVEATLAELEFEVVVVWDSTRLPPPLVQSMVAL